MRWLISAELQAPEVIFKEMTITIQEIPMEEITETIVKRTTIQEINTKEVIETQEMNLIEGMNRTEIAEKIQIDTKET